MDATAHSAEALARGAVSGLTPPDPRQATAPAGTATSGSDDDFMDVWSRSGTKYLLRAALLLSINVLLFACVGVFAFWLRTGEVFAPTMEGYGDQILQTFRFGSQTAVTLGSLLLHPISVQQVGMQILVVGLLMATLISIPILVAILYRFWSSLPFIAIVGFLAVMPWLAITLLGSCIMASVRPFRSRFRFMSALFGLVPAVVYLVLAFGNTAEEVVGAIDPVDRIKFVAPWVLAIVAAAAVFALVLLIAKMVNYRTGAVTPLLAIMFLLPVFLFEYHVGRDELYYRLLVATDRAHFSDVDASLALDQAVSEAWARHPVQGRTLAAVRQIAEQRWLFGLTSDVSTFQSALTRHQWEVVDRCDRFLHNFPASRYAVNALYIRARALDQRVDAAEFRRTNWIRYYDDFPGPASRDTWRMLVRARPDSPATVVARLRAAQIDAREGDVERAADELNRLLATAAPLAAETGGRPGLRIAIPETTAQAAAVPFSAPPETELDVPIDRIIVEAARLRDMLIHNRDPLYGYDPLCGPRDPHRGPLWFGLLDLDPGDEYYAANLVRLRDAYPHAQVTDNIDLEIAKCSPFPAEQIQRLETLLERFAERDAVPEALYRLCLAYRSVGHAARQQATMDRLLREHEASIWARLIVATAPALPQYHEAQGAR